MVTEQRNPVPGVNIFGYFFAESGVGEHSRQLVETVRKTGIPYTAVPYTRTLTRQQHRFEDPNVGAPTYPINIVSVNADELPHFAADVGDRFLQSRYSIGLWAWEIEEFPATMAKSQKYLDEIWANSSFSAAAIQKKVDCPVFPFPLPVSVPEITSPDRAELGLQDGFVFLFCFDYDSIFERKNPTALIRAFQMAFPGDERVSLKIKTINGAKQPEKLELLRDLAGMDSRINLVDAYWSSERTRALMSACDAYVSLHRAEGFGLTMAETMAYGKPVIATNYSGNLDFMDERNSYLVPARPAEIDVGCEPYPKGALWSEPDVAEAAQLMRWVVAHPDEARQKGDRGRADIENHHSPGARSRFVYERISAIADSLPEGISSAELPGLEPGFGTDEDPAEEIPLAHGFVGAPGNESEAITNYATRLEEGPDLRCQTGLGRLGIWIRKLIFRILRNYHLHQVQLGRAGLLVMRELDQSSKETRQRLEALERLVSELDQNIASQNTTGNSREHG